MKRSLLLLLTLFFAIYGKASITVGDNQVWWGYFNAANASSLSYGGYIGNSSACTIDAAIKIPATEDMVNASAIKAIRLWLGTDVSAISSAMRVWISTSLPKQGSVGADYRKSVPKANIVGGLNEIELDSAFIVDHRDIYVGYTITINKKAYPIMAYGTDVPDGFYFRSYTGTSYGSWYNFYGNEYGRLALQVLLESDSFPTNRVSVADFGETMVVKGTDAKIPITITNKGANAVKSISYTITSDDGEPSEETRKSFTSLAVNADKTLSITFPATEQLGKSKKVFTVTKVNDEPNTLDANSGTGFIISIKEKMPVTPVIEEFTGTWCGWCPRGIVGMEKVHEAYGDQIVQIAVHNSDPMAISAYNSVVNAYVDGFPHSITDRQFEADPSFANLRSALNKSFARMASAAIELSAEWTSEAQESVKFNTTTRFAYSQNNNQYAIAFVLTEDGLKGTGSNWAQTNYYSGQGSSGEMSFWYKMGSSVTGLEYNHVAVAGWSVLNGVNNSVNPNIEADEEQEFSYTGSISSNSVIQDKTKLTAIALLIDRSTGYIVNAAQSKIADFATPIDEVQRSVSKTQQDVFDISGRKLSASQKGINIIRMTDGTVKKVLVK